MESPNNSSVIEATITPEIYFLISKFLALGPCKRTAEAIKQDIEEHKLMPKRVDWLGTERSQTLADVERSNTHIKNDHLIQICSRIGSILDKEIPPSIPGVASLLGAGRQSLLRRKTDPPRRHTLSSLTARIHGAAILPSVDQVDRFPTNVVNMLISRENCGKTTVRQTIPSKLYNKQQMHRRLLGHLSSVYCVAYDRSGQYIFTGSDDLLVKIWNAKDGRLLSTLRGQGKEVADLAVNYENTLLAVGGCDKTIRIWCLRTTSTKIILTGHSNEITSVKFCPLIKGNIRYLISTANDGCVCFWKWDVETHEFDPKPQKFIERTKPGVHLLCSSFSSGGVFLAVGGTDHFVRVYHLNGPASKPIDKIFEIDVHTGQVDSIQFSNLGYRFISGSKDGTAHIWWYERRNWTNTLLKMSTRLPSDPPIDDEELNKIRVNMVGWTCDDSYVVTSASDHSVKVWNPNTGELIHSLRGHENEVFVLEAHPLDPRIFLSGGHDGKIILWDIVTGTIIKKICSFTEGQGPGAIFDCKFSPDGQTFSSTDSHGHLTIFGFGSNERYQKMPEHVFFHTDYRPLIRDANNHVIDEQTQCPPHLMPPPFLVDIDGNPHPPALQRLVPGRENDSDERLVPHISIRHERGVNEILDPFNMPDPHNVNNNLPNPPNIDVMIQIAAERLQQEQVRDRVNYEHQYAAPQLGEPSNSNQSNERRQSLDNIENNNPPIAEPGRAGDIEGVRQSIGNWQSRDSTGNVPVYAKRIVVKALKQSDLNVLQKRNEAFAQFEQFSYTRESIKKPIAQSVQSSKDRVGKEKLTRRKRRMAQQRQGVRGTINTDRNNSNRRRPRVFDYENPEDIVSESGTNSLRSGADSWTNSTSSESESEDEEEEEITPSSWKRSCKELLNNLFSMPDSLPFRFAVDPIQYPDYYTLIDNPMDLHTVDEQLMIGQYETPLEFRKDIRLIFSNSKEYTPNKRSKIHVMTVRMSTICEDKITSIINDYKSALNHKSRSKSKADSSKKLKTKKVKQRKSLRKKPQRNKLVSSPDLNEPGPSTSGYNSKPASSQSSVSINGRSTRKRLRISSDDEVYSPVPCRGPATNGQQSKDVNFYKALVESEESEEDEPKVRVKQEHELVNNHEDSETEIEDQKTEVGQDSEATEIDDQESIGTTTTPPPHKKRKRNWGTKRKASAFKKAKLSPVGSIASPSAESNSSGFHLSGGTSSTGSIASEEVANEDEGSDYEIENYFIKRSSRRAKKGKKRRKTRGSSRLINKESGSDYEYGDCGRKLHNGSNVSSRGRVIKPKGHARAQTC